MYKSLNHYEEKHIINVHMCNDFRQHFPHKYHSMEMKENF